MIGALLLVLAVGVIGVWLASPMLRQVREPPVTTVASTVGPTTQISGTGTTPPSTAVASTTEPPLVRAPGTVPGWTVGERWGSVAGLTMFRGNPTRTWYGTGPLPQSPTILWRYPEEAMCRSSMVSGEAEVWCGTGWTGQPVVWERPDGITEVIFGALDGKVHFVDGSSGVQTRQPFVTGDLIKGSVTLDPDGFPLIYFGSRDNRLRVVALDREVPTELWSLDAAAVDGVWNNDWDGNPAVVDDTLYEGGENSWFFAIALNRRLDSSGLVGVDPQVLLQVPGYTDQLFDAVGRNVSIESSPVLFEQRAYFTNGGGRVVGLDVSRITEGDAPIVFDFWMGDDVDATPVVDADGSLYVAAELERGTQRSQEVGQLVRLDPEEVDDPLRWGISIPQEGTDAGGIWATPALWEGFLYVPTNPGELLAVEAETGRITWRDDIGWHAWSSPVIVEDTLLVATCTGELRFYDLQKAGAPVHIMTVTIPSGTCIESTPAVWNGRVYVGGRDGYVYAVGET